MKRIYLLLILIIGSVAVKAQQDQKNILFIISDDHAYQSIGAYGATFNASPQLDKLANEGAVFENAFVTNSICGPSRAVFLTGKYSHINGFRDNFSTFEGSQPHFMRDLTNAGYQTAWIGKWHLVTMPQGFSYFKILPGQGEYYNPEFINMQEKREKYEGYVTNVITDLTIDYLEKRDKSKPFCLVVGEKAAHRNWTPDTTDFDLFNDVIFPLPDNFYDAYTDRTPARLQNMNIAESMQMRYDLKMTEGKNFAHSGANRLNPQQRARYDAHYLAIEKELKQKNLTGNALIEWKFQRYMKDYLQTAVSLDRNIGKIIDYIDANGLRENTLVIYTSDQGFYLGEHGWFDKRFMYEESFKTPLIVRYPQWIKPNTRKNELVMNLDFAPTLLQYAGVKVPEDMQGKSMLPILKSKSKREIKFRDQLYYHYFEYPNEHNVFPHYGIRDKRYKLIRFYKPEKSWELYDLKTDPGEVQNLINDKKYERVKNRMKKQLKKLIVQYKDYDALNNLND